MDRDQPVAIRAAREIDGIVSVREMGRPADYLQSLQKSIRESPKPDTSILGHRLLALLIDGAIAVPLVFVAILPIFSLIGTPALVAYYLSRDILMGNGQSIGKKAMGLKVEKVDGSEVTWNDSFMRNIVFLGYLALICFTVPWFGWLAAIFLLIPVNLVFLAETIVVISTGKRIGEHMSGKTYVTRA